MKDDRTPAALYDRIREGQDAALGAADRAPGRERFVRHSAVRRSPTRARARTLGLLAAAALVAVLALVLLPARSLQFEVDGARGRASVWMAAPATGTSELRFSDGTELDLREEGRARVEDVDARGARVVLERGTVDARVVHRPDTRWLVQAGPFDVRVTGTHFVTSWDPGEGHFVLVLEEGSVEVTGPTWQGERSVRAGERIDLRVSTQARAAVAPASDVALAPRASASVAPRTPEPLDAPTGTSPVPRTSPSASAAIAPDGGNLERIRELAAKNAHREAYDLAVSSGLLDAEADAATTALLADVSRLSGHASSARKLLERLRSRFPASRQASEAAFVLGRMDFDAGQTGRAQRWFSTYLAERPNGPLAVEARGRVLECLLRSGDRDAIAKAADLYLEQYPSGPHAEVARRASSSASPSSSSSSPSASPSSSSSPE